MVPFGPKVAAIQRPVIASAGAFYLRLTGQPVEIYGYLEPLFNDFRRVRMRQGDGTFVLSHVDEVCCLAARLLVSLYCVLCMRTLLWPSVWE